MDGQLETVILQNQELLTLQICSFVFAPLLVTAPNFKRTFLENKFLGVGIMDVNEGPEWEPELELSRVWRQFATSAPACHVEVWYWRNLGCGLVADSIIGVRASDECLSSAGPLFYHVNMLFFVGPLSSSLIIAI